MGLEHRICERFDLREISRARACETQDGEFIGGCDLMIEMYQNGELQEMIEKVAAE